MSSKKVAILLVVISIISTLVYYFVTLNIILSFILFVLSLFISLYISLYVYKNYKAKLNILNECINFINKFIISLSVNPSTLVAFNSCNELISNSNHLKLKEIDDVDMKIIELSKIYNLQLFDIFNGIIFEFIDKGGNILTYSKTFLREARRIQFLENSLYNKRKIGYLTFIFMWFIALLVPIIARISLNSFYENFINNFGYIMIVFIGFLLFIFSSVVYFFTNSNLKFARKGKYETKK